MLRILGQIPRGSLHDSPYNGNIICFAGNLFLLEMHYILPHSRYSLKVCSENEKYKGCMWEVVMGIVEGP